LASPENKDQREEDYGFEDLGEIVGSRYYEPSLSDFKLLIGTKEWPQVMQNEDINENTFDPADPE